jgi:D-arabinose 1-dehydrogenase-like Zn-dependent alcohol dehydrogenase
LNLLYKDLDLRNCGGFTTVLGSVGKALTKDGKIILLGCEMGLGHYGKSVANVTKKQVFASTGKFGAANEQTALKRVQSIEKGGVSASMKRFQP